MDKKESNNQLKIDIKDSKDEKFKEKVNNTIKNIIKNREEKSENFIKSLRKYYNDENYEFKHLLIEGHFFFKVVCKLNDELFKNNEEFLFDYGEKLLKKFDVETSLY